MKTSIPSTPEISRPAMDGKAVAADRARRMQWWHEAKFGMFIHYGLYSLIGRHEQVMELEGMPLNEYEGLARQFRPRPDAATQWARLARRSGMKYMVLTTKHHDGFCLFKTAYTAYSLPAQAGGRDLVAEYVAAARAEGLRVGLYYSLRDWHHPDGRRCADDEAARRRLVDYIHGQIRELCTQYGKIDVMWYDVAWPLEADGWESERMNRMVYQLQPDIIINDRNKIPGDFGTPEGVIQAEERGWETCMSMNDSWGYHRADDAWKRPKTIVQQLVSCAGGGGNYLLNVGPMADGTAPPEAVQILDTVGAWVSRNGEAIYGTERLPRRIVCRLAGFTRKGRTLYAHVWYWPGSTVALAGLQTKVRSVRRLATGEPVRFVQDLGRVQLLDLPEAPPDNLATVFALECESEPLQAFKPREDANHLPGVTTIP